MKNYFWHHSEFVRDIYTAVFNLKYRMWIRFADKHKLWVHVDQKFLDERKDWKIFSSNV